MYGQVFCCVSHVPSLCRLTMWVWIGGAVPAVILFECLCDRLSVCASDSFAWSSCWAATESLQHITHQQQQQEQQQQALTAMASASTTDRPTYVTGSLHRPAAAAAATDSPADSGDDDEHTNDTQSVTSRASSVRTAGGLSFASTGSSHSRSRRFNRRSVRSNASSDRLSDSPDDSESEDEIGETLREQVQQLVAEDEATERERTDRHGLGNSIAVAWAARREWAEHLFFAPTRLAQRQLSAGMPCRCFILLFL